MSITPTLMVHGGAFHIERKEMLEATTEGAKRAAKAGYQVLMKGGSVTEAVETAVCALEDDPLFDAGTGSVLNADGQIEMDAVIMEGDTLRAGGVACVRNIKNPVKLAKSVMEKTQHVLLVGEGANKFAREQGVPAVPTDELLCTYAKEQYAKCADYRGAVSSTFMARSNHDTVGCVAIDSTGNMAAATSTGGITAKKVGRVGDAPLVGCGVYCDNNIGGISCTGHGESIIKVCLASRVMNMMSAGVDEDTAAKDSLDYMFDRVGGAGGVIVLNKAGKATCHFTTTHMPWAYQQGDKCYFGVSPHETLVEET